jgi:uncharacterized protein (TIGR00266 family)
MRAHEVDYKVYGEEMQCVEVELDPNETAIAEAGGLMMMDSGIEMQTIFGDGSGQDEGIFGKLWSAGKRVLSGESLFMTAFTNITSSKKKATFASPYPGKIIPLNLVEHQGTIICQKQAFLCAAKGVSVDIEFQRKIGVGLFGGEGFIMEKIQGDGMAFLHGGGTILERLLLPGEVLKVDTGCIMAFSKSVTYEIEFVGGIKNTLFGGEGLYFATLRGPGKVWIQSLPFSRLADRVIAAAPKMGGKRVGEGSILGNFGDLLDGRNRF